MTRVAVLGIAAVLAAGVSVPALAISASDSVTVNITVDPVVSLWADHATVNLVLNGANPENSASFQSGINYINNVNAKIDVNVAGTLPAPIVPGGGINFFIFKGVTAAQALLNIAGNAYNPAGALVWTNATVAGAGTTQTLDPGVGVNTSIDTQVITYGAASPGELPLPNSFSLTVTYTITSL